MARAVLRKIVHVAQVSVFAEPRASRAAKAASRLAAVKVFAPTAVAPTDAAARTVAMKSAAGPNVARMAAVRTHAAKPRAAAKPKRAALTAAAKSARLMPRKRRKQTKRSNGVQALFESAKQAVTKRSRF